MVFTIADGYASGNNTITRVLDGVSLSLTAGGGIYNNYSSPKLTNVTISGNSANLEMAVCTTIIPLHC